MTLLLIGVSIAVYLIVAVGPAPEPVGFVDVDTDREVPAKLTPALEWAAIPCEVVQGRPLTTSEVSATYYESGEPYACDAASEGPPVFADKRVRAAVVFSMFLHDGLFHLGLNMLFLWVFGNNIEDRLGHVAFLIFYLVAGIVATGTYIAFQSSSTVAILGASGAVAAVMGSYLVWYPDAPIRTLVFLVLVDIRARWFLGTWFAIQFFTWTGPGAWIAHVAGFVVGVAFGRLFRRFQPRLRLRPGQRAPAWDQTGGAGHGPYPHLDEVWLEPHHEQYE
ncbi:MAG: rhomboid family intramembrane serine protease [Acidimicrobiales bacterium]